MSLLGWIIVFSLLGGVLSVLAASVFLLINDEYQKKLLPHTVSFAIGALLGAALLALLPHAITVNENVDMHDLGLTILMGLLGFFLLEKMVLWRHCHSSHCEVHAPGNINTSGEVQAAELEHHHQNEKDASGTLIIIGDAVHNLVDGVLIAAAFMTDIDLGIVTALAVAAHEIPQEIGDFAILLNSGYKRGRALFFNVLASMATIVGAVIAYYSLQSMQHALPYILAIAASSFIYIAVADLIPGLHKKTELRETLQQITLIILGVTTIYWAHSTLH
ncbi:MAG: ZIP family metal transporter [Gammaproteobacteria bacterium]|nr:ZIP family metal transporter [Gammaproteobacteria bacterium]